MTENQNTEYELFAKEIYETLLKDEGVKTIDVQHNIKLMGNSGCEHQIDVYWEFEMVGIKHRVAIECKNYTSNVSIGKIRDFYGVLTDVGNIQGIFVTKKGFQKGAKQYADSKGIKLMELRFPESSDWEGRIRDLHFNISVLKPPVVKNIVLSPDTDWIKENMETSKAEKFQIPIKMDTVVQDDSGNKVKTVGEMYRELPNSTTVGTGYEHEYNFDNGFLINDVGMKLKIKSFKFIYDVIVSDTTSFAIEGDKVAKAILKDVKSGEISFFDKAGNVKRRNP
ncbi:restriction endonuclease [Paenibacillus sp. LX16]|uniref:restriction endonuclease n=1 Tax=Paenibacillus sp. LX16 TaxID=1740264 RepID=UPI002E2A6D7C|nr:restriction endonuclease [Paenibacillus sp. LX16]